MLSQFYSDLRLDGCYIQVGTENMVLRSETELKDIGTFLEGHKEKNLYFLADVDISSSQPQQRAKDEWMKKKHYFYLDLDIRKSNPSLTDEKIKTEIAEWAKGILKSLGAPYSNWRYIVFTGNGLHFYYFGDAVHIVEGESETWRAGINDFIDVVESSTQEKFDRACSNLARIARLPGSHNNKQQPAKPVEIIDFQNEKIDMALLIKRGRERIEKQQKEADAKAKELQQQFPDEEDVYRAIQKIPVAKLMCMLTGWELEKDGVHFMEMANKDRKGCYVGEIGNVIIHGGTPHLPYSAKGFSPFQLVQNYLRYDNFQTFLWFKQRFPEIKALSMKKDGVVLDIPSDYSIKNAFSELRTMEVRQLNMGLDWDDWRIILRGKVTRIGAMPGTGKSKLGYYITHCLLKKEYRGLFFSTEVQAAEVIAHLLQINMEKPYLDILEHRVEVPVEFEDDYRNLKVYDVRHTGNSLAKIEQIIKRECDKSEANNMRGVDFVVVDFSQQVTPKSGKSGDIFNWAWEWGNECQEISQKYGVAFIDVCQLSVKGNKDEDEKYGHIPYEGGNKLLQTADIATMISRDKSVSAQNNQVIWDVRKSKSMGRRFRLAMDYDWNTGKFLLDSGWDSRDGMSINYHQIRKEREQLASRAKFNPVDATFDELEDI